MKETTKVAWEVGVGVGVVQSVMAMTTMIPENADKALETNKHVHSSTAILKACFKWEQDMWQLLLA